MVYKFDCQNPSCGAETEVTMPMVSASFEDRRCLACGGDARHRLEAPAVATQNMTNQPLDVVVGRDAEIRWTEVHRRQELRDAARRRTGQIGLTEAAPDQFTALSPEQQRVRTAALAALG